MSVQKKSRANTVEHTQLKWGYVFIAPCIFGLLVFHFGPILFSLYISFTDWNVITQPSFIGGANYVQMANDPLIWKSLSVTAYYTLLTVPLITVVMFLVATLLNTRLKGISVFRTIFYIPSIVPVVASSAIWLYIFNPMFGLLNTIFRMVGISPQNFIFSSSGAVPGLAMMAVWAAGNTMVIYLAGLQNISAQLYEASNIDGANAFHRFIHITVPIMTPIIFYNMLMAIIASMQAFTQAFIMTNGGPDNASLFLALHMYKTAFQNGQMGNASAMSWVMFIIVAVLTAIVFKTSNKWVFYENKGD